MEFFTNAVDYAMDHFSSFVNTYLNWNETILIVYAGLFMAFGFPLVREVIKKMHRMTRPEAPVNVNRAPYNLDCPVCFEQVIIGAEANCGHIVCSSCIKALNRRRAVTAHLICPMCRRKIYILFPYKINADEEEDNELKTMITNYNYLDAKALSLTFIWSTICNMPSLLLHLFEQVFGNGLQFDRMMYTVLLFLSVAVIYVVLPTDIFPEIAFGVFGFVDDIIVVFYCLFHLSMFYRYFLANIGET